MVELKEVINTENGKLVIIRRGDTVSILHKLDDGGVPVIINIEHNKIQDVIVALLAAWKVTY